MQDHLEDPTGTVLLASVQPVRTAVVDLVQSAQRARPTSGHPAADSPAMAELAATAKYVGEWTNAPFEFAHDYASMSLLAAEDQLLDACHLVTPFPGHDVVRASLFGVKTLGRAVLEAAGRAAYLCEPGISYEARVCRGQADRLYSVYEV